MKKNNARFHESPKNQRRLKAVLLRGMIVLACLIIVGSGLVLLTGRDSRAAMRQQQEGKASQDGVWQELVESSFTTGSSDHNQREVGPKAYQTVRFEKAMLMNLLAHAPLEFTTAARSNPVELTLPLPDGKFGRFSIVESPMLEPAFAAQFPEIKTFRGTGIDDPTATTRFDITIRGFHAIILSSDGTIFVAPGVEKLTPDGAASTRLDEATEYISYFQRDDPRERQVHCAAENSLAEDAPGEDARAELHRHGTRQRRCGL